MSNNSNCNTTCPACGKPGLQLFSSIECYTQPDCVNYRPPEAEKPKKDLGYQNVKRYLGFDAAFPDPAVVSYGGLSNTVPACTKDSPTCGDHTCVQCYYQTDDEDSDDDDSDFEREETDPGIGPQTWLRVTYTIFGGTTSYVYRPGEKFSPFLRDAWWESEKDYEPAEGWPKLDRYGKPIKPPIKGVKYTASYVDEAQKYPFFDSLTNIPEPTAVWKIQESPTQKLYVLNEWLRIGLITPDEYKGVLGEGDTAKEKPQAVNPGLALDARLDSEEAMVLYYEPSQPCTDKEPSLQGHHTEPQNHQPEPHTDQQQYPPARQPSYTQARHCYRSKPEQ